MRVYQTKSRKIPGTNFSEVRHTALQLFKKIQRKSKRTPYVRSAYFNKEKVFLTIFLHHLYEKKDWKDRTRRLQFFETAIELIEKSRCLPRSVENPNKRSEWLHRFAGITPHKELFYVQIKEDKISGKKYLISFFPEQ